MTISNEVKEYLRDIQSHLLALLFLMNDGMMGLGSNGGHTS